MSCYKLVRGLAIVWYMIVTHLQGLMESYSIKCNFDFISSLYCH